MAKLLTNTIVTFQGGGIYDDNKQLMKAGKLDDGNYIFIDTSRGLDGIVEPSELYYKLYPIHKAGDMIDHIKSSYLHDDYKGSVQCQSEYCEALRELQNWKG